MGHEPWIFHTPVHAAEWTHNQYGYQTGAFLRPSLPPSLRGDNFKIPNLSGIPSNKRNLDNSMGKIIGKFSTRWWKTNTAGTDSLFVMTHKDIWNIPKDQTVTNARMVVNYRPQKPDPNQVCITAEINLIKYPGELTTRTADLTTSNFFGTVC